ncbi:MAG: peptidoglycan DD-metalloendopeptidase family protein [Patescibacteria group bacterium]
MEIFKRFKEKVNSKRELYFRYLRNRIPENFFDFFQKKIVPYLSIGLVAAFTLIADVAQAAENNQYYVPEEEQVIMSPAEIAEVVTEVGPYTEQISEDPLTVALAVENENFLDKPQLATTEITAEEAKPKEEKRTKTITYTVDEGDTLSKIAWTYGLKVASIKSVNNISSDTIKSGQQLKLPPQDIAPKALASLKQKPTVVPFSGTFRRPTSGWAVSQGFGRTSFERFHDGVDLDRRSGTTIFASASGKVVRASRGWGGGFGNHIIIDHGGGWQTLYGHMSSFSVGVGQWVNQGQIIGIMGNSGWSTGVHVHFRITKNGTPLNPMNYL